jgi:hypothetical protein
VQGGYVPLEQACEAYGVAIDPERMIVLEDETAAFRAGLRDGDLTRSIGLAS